MYNVCIKKDINKNLQPIEWYENDGHINNICSTVYHKDYVYMFINNLIIIRNNPLLI